MASLSHELTIYSDGGPQDLVPLGLTDQPIERERPRRVQQAKQHSLSDMAWSRTRSALTQHASASSWPIAAGVDRRVRMALAGIHAGEGKSGAYGGAVRGV